MTYSLDDYTGRVAVVFRNKNAAGHVIQVCADAATARTYAANVRATVNPSIEIVLTFVPIPMDLSDRDAQRYAEAHT